MNRRTMVILGIVAAAALVIGFAASAMGSDQASSTAKPSRTITVTSTATVKAKPDEALVTFGVRSEDADSTAAMAQNAKDMQAVLDALKAAGIAGKDIQTLGIGLDQRIEKRGQPSERRIFVASNSVQVTIHDLGTTGRVIDAAVGAGADSVSNIQFLLSDPNTIRTDALSQAVKGARTKADALAQAAGAKVLGVVTINEEAFRAPVYRAPFQQKLGFIGAAAAPTPVVPPDSLEVSVTVSVVWEID
jgi:uncharacterized protein